MRSLVRLLLLALAVSAVAAQRRGRGRGRGGRSRGGRGGRRPSPPDMEQVFSTMQEAGCLPEDFSSPDLSACQGVTRSQKLQCLANSAGFSTDSPYDQAAAEAFIDERSSDADWRAGQKQALTICASMLTEGLSNAQQNIFMMTCAIQLAVANCSRQRLVAAVEAVDSENGKEIAEAVAAMAEGHCFKKGIKYSKEAESQWLTCATEGGLDLNVLKGAFIYYMMIVKGENSLPEISAENVTAVAEELEKLDTVAECYALASGEVSSDGEIDYDQMRTTIDGAKGKEEVKAAAKEIVNYCEGQNPTTIGDFYECYIASQGYACAALRSYAIVTVGPPRRNQRG